MIDFRLRINRFLKQYRIANILVNQESLKKIKNKKQKIEVDIL